MTAPYLVACLAVLRAEFNTLAPGRDKGADGWIGDAAHQARASDHNPDAQGRVLAVDIDSTGPWPVDFTALVESLRGSTRLEYIIWNRRIASRDQSWTWRTYTGSSDPHTGHAHFSARHDHTGNTSTASWDLEEFVALSEGDKDWLADRFAEVTAYDPPQKDGTPTSKIGRVGWSQGIPNGLKDGAPRDVAWQVLQDLGEAVAALTAKVDALADKLTPPTS